MTHDSYEDWYDNGPGSVAFARKMRESEISFKQKEFDRRRKLDELRDLVLWMQECRELTPWVQSKCPMYGVDNPDFDRWMNAHCSLHRETKCAEQAVYDWRP